jgi:hypothetical protein
MKQPLGFVGLITVRNNRSSFQNYDLEHVKATTYLCFIKRRTVEAYSVVELYIQYS